MPYAQNRSQPVYYEVHGDGDPLVLLPGGVQTIDLTFGALLPKLAAGHRCIAVELQGHGHTPDGDREFTLANCADDVAAVLDDVGVPRADVFGFSLGGLTAIELAMRHPHRVRRMVAAATHYRSDGYHEEILDPAQWATSTRMPTAADFADMQAAYRAVAPDPGHLEAFQAKVSRAPHMADDWSLDDLAAIDAPTLLVVGDTDFVRLDHAVHMQELIGAQLAVLPGTTHTGLIRRADLLLPMLSTFLA